MNLSEIIRLNPSLLIVLEHFSIDEVLPDKSVSELCRLQNISEKIFLIVCNCYNGFSYGDTALLNSSDIPSLILYLRNSHNYYKKEKYPEIINYIKQLRSENNLLEMKLVEEFFNEYFEEVQEHLEYEERIVFPYLDLLKEGRGKSTENKFSAREYLNHHSDIESKLSDLKNLLLGHLHIRNRDSIKRKLLFSLFELEFDLKIHSNIEDQILIPLAISIEKSDS